MVTFAEDLEEMEIIMESDSSPENNNVEKSEEVSVYLERGYQCGELWHLFIGFIHVHRKLSAFKN